MMKTTERRIFFILLMVAFVAFQPLAIAKGKGDRKTVKQLQKHIGFLASDSLEGRRTGTEGERKAATYIINKYKEYGISPYNYNYRYPFHFAYGKEIAASSQILIDNKSVSIGKEAFPLPFSATKRTYSDALMDVMEQGNTWVMSLYTDQAQADDPHFDWEKHIYEHARDAAKQGAMGVVFYDAYGSKLEPEFNKHSDYEALEIPVVFFKHDAYQKYIRYDASNNPKVSAKIDLNITINKADRSGTNVAAFIDNKAPYTVIIGAHYDHLGYGEDGNSLFANAVKEHQVHHGADDNASGTAALLEVAEWINKHKKTLKHYNYLFIHFSGEELGLYGSKAFVREENIDSTHIAYMINMDMVGRLNDSTHLLTLGGVGTSPSWAEVVDMGNKQFKLSLDSSGIGPSDHTTFYNAGIPVLFLFTGTHKDYHKPSDVAELINYNGEADVIDYCEAIISKLDEKNIKPAYTVTKQSSVGKTRFKVTLGIMPDYTYQDGGLRVDGVIDGRPAAKAGLKAGDIITMLGSYKVQGIQSYMEALGKLNPGEKSNVTLTREGKEMVLPIEFSK